MNPRTINKMTLVSSMSARHVTTQESPINIPMVAAHTIVMITPTHPTATNMPMAEAPTPTAIMVALDLTPMRFNSSLSVMRMVWRMGISLDHLNSRKIQLLVATTYSNKEIGYHLKSSFGSRSLVKPCFL